MFIDTNVYIDQWPFRELPGAGAEALLAKFSHYGVEQAWTSSFDSLLHKDLTSVNARLAEACAVHDNGVLVPFGAINPALPRWNNDLDRCVEEHGMTGIRLHPAYHGYTLDDPRFRALLQEAAERKLLVQLVVTMEDERMMHPLARVEHVDVTPLPGVLADIPAARVLLLNAFRGVRGDALSALVKSNRVWFDIAWLEGIEGITKISGQIPLEKLVFGSYAPFFYFESSLLKLKESALHDAQLAQIQGENAHALSV